MLDKKSLNDQFTDVLECPITKAPYFMVTKLINHDLFLEWAYDIIHHPGKAKRQLILKSSNDMTIVKNKKKVLKYIILSDVEISKDERIHNIGFFIKYPMSPHIKTVLNILFNCKSVQLIVFDFTFLLAALIQAGFNVKSSNLVDLQTFESPEDANDYFKAYRCKSLVKSVSDYTDNDKNPDYKVFQQNKKYYSDNTPLDVIKKRYYKDDHEKFVRFLFSNEHCRSSIVQCVLIGIDYYEILLSEKPLDGLFQKTQTKYNVFMEIMKKYNNNPMAPALQKNWYYLPEALKHPPSDCSQYVRDEAEAYKVIIKAQRILDHYDLYQQMFQKTNEQQSIVLTKSLLKKFISTLEKNISQLKK